MTHLHYVRWKLKCACYRNGISTEKDFLWRLIWAYGSTNWVRTTCKISRRGNTWFFDIIAMRTLLWYWLHILTSSIHMMSICDKCHTRTPFYFSSYGFGNAAPRLPGWPVTGAQTRVDILSLTTPMRMPIDGNDGVIAVMIETLLNIILIFRPLSDVWAMPLLLWIGELHASDRWLTTVKT